MNVALISVGTEIIIGDILNTNVQFLSKELAKIGINVYKHVSVGDNEDRLIMVIDDAFKMADTLILTGGLGPTEDDITKEVAAKYLGIELEFSSEIWDRIKKYGEKFAKDTEITMNNKKQAFIPKNSIILENIMGSAPGAIMEKNGKRIIILPGPPREMKSMYENSLKPYLKKYSNKKILSKYIRIYGIGESALEEKLETIMKNQKDVTIALYAKNGEVLIRVTTSTKGIKEINCYVEKIQKLCGEYIYLIGDENISESQSELDNIVIDKIIKKINSFSIFESGTYGLLTHTLSKSKEIIERLKETIISFKYDITEENVLKLLNSSKEELAIVLISDSKIHDNTLIDDVFGIIGIKLNNNINISKFNFRGVKQRIENRIVLETLNEIRKNI